MAIKGVFKVPDGQGGFLDVHPETDSELVNGLKELIQGGTSAYSVEIPAQSGSLIYNGTTLQPRWTSYNQNKMTISGITEATNAGTYQVTFTPKGEYEWSDGTTNTVTVEWTISRAVIEEPSCSDSFTYDGNEKSPTMSYDTAATVVDGTTSAVNAATYIVGFTPDSNHCWSGGTYERKTFSWTIDKAAGALSLTKTTMTLNNDKVSDTCEVTRAGTGTITVTSNNTSVATVSLSDTTVTVTAVDSGSVTITISIAADDNYTAPADKTISVTCTLFKALNQCTPAEMQEIIQAGNANAAWSVGNTFTTTVDGESATVKLIGIDHNSSIEGTKRCHFVITKALSDKCYNSTKTNAGGWKSCEIRTWLNNTYINYLPSNLRSVITACTKWTDNSSSTQKDDNACSATSDKIWIASYIENGWNNAWELQNALNEKNTVAYTIPPGGKSRSRCYYDADNRQGFFYCDRNDWPANDTVFDFYPCFTIS